MDERMMRTRERRAEMEMRGGEGLHHRRGPNNYHRWVGGGDGGGGGGVPSCAGFRNDNRRGLVHPLSLPCKVRNHRRYLLK